MHKKIIVLVLISIKYSAAIVPVTAPKAPVVVIVPVQKTVLTQAKELAVEAKKSAQPSLHFAHEKLLAAKKAVENSWHMIEKHPLQAIKIAAGVLAIKWGVENVKRYFEGPVIVKVISQGVGTSYSIRPDEWAPSHWKLISGVPAIAFGIYKIGHGIHEIETGKKK